MVQVLRNTDEMPSSSGSVNNGVSALQGLILAEFGETPESLPRMRATVAQGLLVGVRSDVDRRSSLEARLLDLDSALETLTTERKAVLLRLESIDSEMESIKHERLKVVQTIASRSASEESGTNLGLDSLDQLDRGVNALLSAVIALQNAKANASMAKGNRPLNSFYISRLQM